jgi:hypothetical protein
MNHPPDRNQLLADVLADESSQGFREALLTETLGLVRRRRRGLQLRRAASAVLVIAGLALLVWNRQPLPWQAPEGAKPRNAVVVSQLLPPGTVIATTPLTADQVVASTPTHSILQTVPGISRTREIADAELLALLGPIPAALVRPKPHAAELVFVNPADQAELVRN